MEKTDKSNIQDILTLTPMQEGMLFHYLKEPDSDLYIEQLCLTISGEIDPKLFEKAWNYVIETNEMLRTVFHWEGLEKPIQIILKEYFLQAEFYNFTGKSKKEIGKSAAHVKKSERGKISLLHDEIPFRAALCKLEIGRYEIIVSNHHILYDGWSSGILLKEFFQAYADFAAFRAPLKPVKTGFKEFVKWLSSRRKEKEEEYWRNYLQGFETQTTLSIKKRSENQAITVGHFQIGIEKTINDKIEDLVKGYKITLASLFYCSWGLLLHKYNNTDDVVFGTTVSGRPVDIRGIETLVGLFINTVPLRVQSCSGEKISTLLHRIDDTLKEREAYENTPLLEIKEYSSWGVQEELFDNIAVIENYPLENALREGKTGGLAIDSHSMVENPHYDLTLGVIPADETVLSFDFKEELFDRAGINDLACHMINILSAIIDNPNREIQDIELLSVEEKDRILYVFNNTDTNYPRGKTIHGLFVEQAQRTPDRVGLVGEVGLTYRQLHDQTDRLAGFLIDKDALPDSIVGIMMDRSIDLIIGILGILKAGCAYVPFNPGNPTERIQYMLEDCKAKILLGMEERQKEIIVNCQLLIVNCKLLKGRPRRGLHHSNLAYVIYTSGSTGIPKGVPVTHANLSPLLHWGYKHLALNEDDRVIQNLPFYFDWSVWEIFIALTTGASLHMITEAILLNPGAEVEFILKNAITALHITPTQYGYLLNAGKKLASLKYLFIGAEKLTIDLLERSISSVNDACRIFNMYGPTEATIISAVLEIDKRQYKKYRDLKSVPIGSGVGNARLLVLDKYLALCPVNVQGELYIVGDGVAAGYLNNAELTVEKFINNWSYRSYRTNILYKTGDLARWLADGTVEFLGRVDHQVKIRGFRVEPGEIEKQLLTHETVKEAVVIAGQAGNGEEFLCAYVVPSKTGKDNIPHWREHLQKKLPGYMVPAHFVMLELIPLTANGKIDRKALPHPESTAAGEYLPPRNEAEKKLAAIWCEILNIDRQRVGIDNNFFELGGHSLKATTLVLKIHKIFNVHIPLSQVFQLGTIRRLAEFIAGATKDRCDFIETAEKKEYYSLSPAQNRLYILQQMEETRTSYNMFHAIIFRGDLSSEKLEAVFRKLIKRHEILRTSFDMVGNEPVQHIHDDVEFTIEYYDLAAHDCEEDIIKRFIRPFNLAKAPLIRVGLIKGVDNRHILLLDMHHIAVDGTSMGIFVNEFVQLYSGNQLAPVKLQYKDFSEWQRKWFDYGVKKSQEDYWLSQFKDEIPHLNLPFDYERPAVQDFAFDQVIFEADRELTGKIKNFVSENGVTIYMVLLAAYIILLTKYSDQEDIVIGTGVLGRTHPDAEQIIGMFVNMLAIRSRPEGKKTVARFLEELKDGVLAAFENQDYPFDELVKKLHLQREYGRNPLFDTEFTFQEDEKPAIDIPGLTAASYEYKNSLLKFDLSLIAFEADGKIHLILAYSPRLFKRATIEMMAAHLVELLIQFPVSKNIELKELRISHRLSAAEIAFNQKDYGFEF